jgi:hypothetical protein
VCRRFESCRGHAWTPCLAKLARAVGGRHAPRTLHTVGVPGRSSSPTVCLQFATRDTYSAMRVKTGEHVLGAGKGVIMKRYLALIIGLLALLAIAVAGIHGFPWPP